MPTDIMYDFGVIDKLENGASFSEFTDEQIRMYVSYKQKQVEESAYLEELLKTQQATQEQMKAEAAFYHARAKEIVAKIGGANNE